MNRFVSLLLVAFSLAAVSLAQPAQAQWVKGRTYYPDGIPGFIGYGLGTTTTATPTGTVTITSSPPGYPFITGGSYTGTVDQEYNWAGPANARTASFGGTDGCAVSGSNNGPGSADSNASIPEANSQSGNTLYSPNQAYFSGGTDTFAVSLDANNIPTKFTRSASLTVDTTAYYIGTATASAVVLLGAPGTSQ